MHRKTGLLLVAGMFIGIVLTIASYHAYTVVSNAFRMPVDVSGFAVKRVCASANFPLILNFYINEPTGEIAYHVVVPETKSEFLMHFSAVSNELKAYSKINSWKWQRVSVTDIRAFERLIQENLPPRYATKRITEIILEMGCKL